MLRSEVLRNHNHCGGSFFLIRCGALPHDKGLFDHLLNSFLRDRFRRQAEQSFLLQRAFRQCRNVVGCVSDGLQSIREPDVLHESNKGFSQRLACQSPH